MGTSVQNHRWPFYLLFPDRIEVLVFMEGGKPVLPGEIPSRFTHRVGVRFTNSWKRFRTEKPMSPDIRV